MFTFNKSDLNVLDVIAGVGSLCEAFNPIVFVYSVCMCVYIYIYMYCLHIVFVYKKFYSV